MAASSLALTLGNTAVRQLDGLFSLNDLHAAAGGEDRHQPAFFMRTEQTQALLAEIGNSAESQSFATRPGRTGGTYACRELVIAYAAWISPAFHLKVIRVFLAVAAPEPAPAAPQIGVLQGVIEQRDRLLSERDLLRKVLAERVLEEQPHLRLVLYYYRIPGLTHDDRAWLMRWKSTKPWYAALKTLRALGLVDDRPGAGPSPGKAAYAKLLAAATVKRATKAQGAVQ